ncbi:GNAT family acetyltransferase [Curvivirga sp.]|uniref:GNAT family acetyltransferase n=1 Tax=Curvivirga sp. TaxID=2856848 RepID=UPI003B5AC7CB
MTNLSIRSYNDDDLTDILHLWEKCDLTRPWNDPAADIETAVNAKESDILVAVDNNKVIASVMLGFDGHRGWVYYLAVNPNHQGKGIGHQISIEAERVLKDKGCAKVMLMIRPENQRVKSIYESWGYHSEDRTLMVKWLKEPPALPSENDTDNQIPVVISYLEMTERPKGSARPLPKQGVPVTLIKLHDCTVNFYRYLYNSIGEKWLWWEKRLSEDSEIEQIVTRETTDQYLLSVGGIPAGWVQLDNLGNHEDRGQTMEIGYFGLFPDFIGKGLGPYLLDFAVRTAWDHPSKPVRVQLNTCTLDHPSALPTYQKAGFSVYQRETQVITDPRTIGVIPKDIELAQPMPAFP